MSFNSELVPNRREKPGCATHEEHGDTIRTMAESLADSTTAAQRLGGRASLIAHARHIVPCLAMRRTTHGSGLGRWRWVVERTLPGSISFTACARGLTSGPTSTRRSSRSGARGLAGSRCARRRRRAERVSTFSLAAVQDRCEKSRRVNPSQRDFEGGTSGDPDPRSKHFGVTRDLSRTVCRHAAYGYCAP